MDIRPSLKTLFSQLRQITAKIQWQHHCTMCSESSHTRICKACEAYWPLQVHCCQTCSLPLKHHAILCGNCLKQRPEFEYAYAPYLYEAPVSQLITRFKNNRDLNTGLALCHYWQYRLKYHYQSQHLCLPDALAPVPTHWRKQWQRGFSHTQFCAEQLGTYFSVPVFNKTRIKHYSDSQKSLNRKQRLRFLSSSFIVDQSIENKTVAIIDDVMTTGATANAFAKALKKAGASRVVVWTLARTPKHQ